MHWAGEGVVEGPSDEAPARFPRRPSMPVSLFVAIAAWIALAAFQACAISLGWVSPELPDGLVSGEYEIQIVEDAKRGAYGYSAHGVLRDAFGARREVLLSYSEKDIEGDARLLARQRVKARVSFSQLSDASFPRYAAKGICARAKVTNARIEGGGGPVGAVVEARCWARDAFDAFEGKGAALLRAILIGDRSRLDEDGLYDDVKTVGLAHMVAVSGAHLSVVAAFVGAILSRARVSRFVSSGVLCGFYVLYAAFTGFASPVIRAALMAGVVANAVWSRRRSSSLAALGVCVCVLLACRPSNALSLSFFLSAASTLGIIVLAPLLEAWVDALARKGRGAITQTLSLTLAANIPIFPVTACVFSRVPLLSPLANLVAAPAFTLFIGGGLVGLGLLAVFPSAGMAALSALAFAADALCDLLGFLAHVPLASVPCSMDMTVATGVSAGAFVALWAIWPRPTKGKAMGAAAVLVASAVALVAVLPLFGPDEIVALDVGQGDAILVKSKGTSLLVDTGNQDALLAAALARAHTAHLDGVAISHHDDDHCASLDSLSSNVAGSRVYVAAETLACGCSGCEALLEQAQSASGAEAVGLVVGDELRVGNFTCRVVWPRAFSDAGGNADSLCLLVTRESSAGNWTALLTGDAEAEQIDEMTSRLPGGSKGIDVLKAGHHGSKAGMTDRLALTLSPKITLVSCGANNRYGHPAATTVEALEAAGSAVFRTDESGDVACVFSDEGIAVRTQRASEVDLE